MPEVDNPASVPVRQVNTDPELPKRIKRLDESAAIAKAIQLLAGAEEGLSQVSGSNPALGDDSASKRALLLAMILDGPSELRARVSKRFELQSLVFALVSAGMMNVTPPPPSATWEISDSHNVMILGSVFGAMGNLSCVVLLAALVWEVLLYVQLSCFAITSEDTLWFVLEHDINMPEVVGYIGIVLALLTLPLGAAISSGIIAGAVVAAAALLAVVAVLRIFFQMESVNISKIEQTIVSINAQLISNQASQQQQQQQEL
jgi:hypothetical protein